MLAPDYPYEEEKKPIEVDRCFECHEAIYEGEEYYTFDGVPYCCGCVREHKKYAEEN